MRDCNRAVASKQGGGKRGADCRGGARITAAGGSAVEGLLSDFKAISRLSVCAEYAATRANHARTILAIVGGLKGFTSGKLQEYFKGLFAAGENIKTVRSKAKSIDALAAFLIERGVLQENPLARVDVPGVPRSLPPALNDAEIAAVLRAAECHGLYPVAGFSIATGLRAGEVVAVKWADVDFETGRLAVRKGDKVTRVVPLNALAVDALRCQQSISAGLAYVFPPSRHYPTPEGRRDKLMDRAPDVGWLAERLRPAREAAEAMRGKRFGNLVSIWHVFRHTFVARISERPPALEDVARWLNRPAESLFARYGNVQATTERNTQPPAAAAKKSPAAVKSPAIVLAPEGEAAIEAFRQASMLTGDCSYVAGKLREARAFVAAVGGLDRINRQTATEYLAGLSKGGNSPKTVRNKANSLRTFVTVLIERGLLAENCFEKLKLPKVPKIPPKFLTDEEIGIVLRQAQAVGMYSMVAVAIGTGLRISEILRLKWEDVDWSGHMLMVGKSKNKRWRKVPLNALARDAIQLQQAKSGAYVHIFPTRCAWSNHRSKGEKVIDKPQCASHVTEKLKPVCQTVAKFAQVGRGKVGSAWHMFRHTFASRLAQEGVSIAKVSEWLGHSSLEMTQRYAHLVEGYDADIERIRPSAAGQAAPAERSKPPRAVEATGEQERGGAAPVSCRIEAAIDSFLAGMRATILEAAGEIIEAIARGEQPDGGRHVA